MVKSEKNANKLWIKWYGNRFKIQLKGCYTMEINSTVFTTPILTAILSTITRCSQNRDT